MADPGPRQPSDRIAAIDALRGFALIGILFFNIIAMGGPIDADAPTSPPSWADSDWQVWWVSTLFVHGAMRGLFSLLFGASTLLFLREGARAGAFLRRCAWLFGFGVLNSTLLLWPGDILMVYAVAGPVLLFFREARPRTLFIAGGVLIAVLSLWSFVGALGQSGANSDAQANATSLEYAARLGSYGDTFAFMVQRAADWTFDISFIWWVLDAAAFMLIGMGLYRLRVLDASRSTLTYLALAIIGMGIGLPLRVWHASIAFTHDGEFPPLAEATFQVGRLAMSLGWLGVFMLAWKLIPWRSLFAPLSALGRMALTGYLAQSAICAFIFSGFGLALWDKLGWLQLWGLVLVIMAGLAVFAMFWLGRFRMGPLEWVWRTLTFWKPQPLLKPAAAAAA